MFLIEVCFCCSSSSSCYYSCSIFHPHFLRIIVVDTVVDDCWLDYFGTLLQWPAKDHCNIWNCHWNCRCQCHNHQGYSLSIYCLMIYQVCHIVILWYKFQYCHPKVSPFSDFLCQYREWIQPITSLDIRSSVQWWQCIYLLVIKLRE